MSSTDLGVMMPVSEQSIVLITSRAPDVRHFGTGFVIHRDAQAVFLLTCAHVVKDVGGAQQVRTEGLTATVIACGDADGPDLAVLRVEGLLDRPAFPLRASGDEGSAFVTQGFQALSGHFLSRPLQGSLGASVTVVPGTQAVRYRAGDLRIDGDYALQPGCSGSPLIDESTGTVVAVVSHSLDAGRKGLAYSVDGLREIWPNMSAGLLGEVATRPVVLPGSPAEPLMNLTAEVGAFEAIASGRDTQTRLILVDGPTGIGKSRLLAEYQRIAASHGLDVLPIPLGPQLSIEDCITTIIYHFGFEHFILVDQLLTAGHPELRTQEKEEEWHRILTLKFFKDLKQYRSAPRLALFFDQYEKADLAFKTWLSKDFLKAGPFQTPLVVVVAGQDPVDPKPTAPGQWHFPLKGVSVDCYRRYAADCNVSIEEEKIEFAHRLLKGEPKRFVDLIRAQSAAATP